MKKLTKILSLILALAMAISLVACANSYGKIKRAFEKAGYEVIETEETANWEEWTSEYGCKVHYFQKTEGILKQPAIILEFKATDDMLDLYKNNEEVRVFLQDASNNEDAKEFYNSLVEKGYANGNCMVIPLSLTGYQSVLDIVKNA